MVVTDEMGNKVYERDNLDGDHYPRINFGSTVWKDYAVEYRVKVVDFVSTKAIATLYFRSSPSLVDYDLQLQPNWHTIIVGYWSGSSWSELKSETFNLVSGNWYLVRVEVEGTQIRVFIDESLMIDIMDERRDSGELGLGVGPGTYAQFDDIRVISLEE